MTEVTVGWMLIAAAIGWIGGAMVMRLEMEAKK